MYDVYITKYKSGNSVIDSWTKIFGVPANDDNGFPVLSPSVKCSEDNAASFDFSMDMNSPYYDAFMHLKTLVCVEYDGDYIFFGRVLTIDNSTVYQTKRVHCEGAFGFMNDTNYEGVVEKDKQKIGWSTYYDRIINNHNAMIQTRSPEKGILRGTVTIDGNTTFVPTTEERKYEPSNWTQTGSLISSLISEFGGHMIVNYRNGGNYLDWYKYYARDLGVNRPTVSIGENIIDISTSANNVDKIFTWVTPMGDSGKDGKPVYLEGYTYTDKNGVSHTINSKHIPVSIVRDVYTDNQLNDEFHSASEYSSAQDNYGDIYKTQTFASAKTQQELWNYTIKWIKECYFGIASSFTIRAYDMHVLDSSRPKILIGDCVNVQYVIMENGLRTVKTKKLVCKSVTYDLFNPDNNSYTFGIPSEILNRTYSEGRGKSGSEQVSGGGGGGGGGDDKNYSYTFTDVYNWIRASNSGPYGGYDNAERFKANGEMSGTVKYYDPEDLPTGETISQHPEIIRTGTIIGRISSTIFVAHDPGKGLFAFNTSTYTYGAVPARHWYTKHGDKVVSSYTPPSALLTDEEKEIIEVASNWGIELKTKDDVADFSNTLFIGLGNTAKGFKTQIWDPVAQKVTEPFKLVIDGLGGIGESIAGFLGLNGGDSKIRISEDGTEDDTAGVEIEPEKFTLGSWLDNLLHPKVQADATTSQVKAGFDQNGNWNSVMNATITWTDEHGVEHTTDGFMKAKDFAIQEIPSFKTKFIAVDQLVADKATIGELNAVKGRVDTLESDAITTRNMSAKNVTFRQINGVRVNANEVNAQQHLILPNGVYLEAAGVWNVNLVDNHDGTYTLKEVKLNGDERTIGTFDRAGGSTIGSVGWSDGVFSVKDINDVVLASTTLQAVLPVPDSSIQKSGKVVYRPYQVMYGADDEHVYSTGKTSTISLDASDVFDDGWHRALQDCEFPGVGTVESFDVTMPNLDTVEGTPRIRTYTISADDDYAYLKRTDSGMSATVARISNPAFQNGKDAIKLALSWNDQNDIGTVSKVTSGSTKNSISFVVSASADIEYNSSTHKYTAKSQGKIDGTARGEEGSITGGTEAYDAGKNAVGLSIDTRESKIKINKSSASITEVLIALGLGSLSGTAGTYDRSRTVSVTANGTTLLSNVISDYKTGWDACKGKVTAGVSTPSWDSTSKKFTAYGYAYVDGTLQKTSGAGSSSALSLDTGSLSGTAGTDNRSRTVKVKHGSTEILSSAIGDYKTGWDACKGKVTAGVSTPSWDSTSKKFTAYGYAYVDGTLQKTSGAGSSSALSLDVGSLSGNTGDASRSRTVKVKHGTTEILSSAISDYNTGYNTGFDASHFAWLMPGSTGDVDTPGPGKYRVIWQKKDGTNVWTSKCWEFPDCWIDIVDYDSSAEVLGYSTTLALVRTWSNGTRQTVRKWNTPGKPSNTIALKQQAGYAGASKMVMYYKDNNGNYHAAGGGASLAWYMSSKSMGNTGSYKTLYYD